MKAAVLHEYGVPRAGEFEAPVAGPEQAVVEVLAAGVNPVDATISAGRFYGGRPTLPSAAVQRPHPLATDDRGKRRPAAVEAS